MMSRKSDSSQFIELEQLKQDKERLLSLLRATREYKDFNDFTNDSGGNLRYLPDEKISSKKKRGTNAKQLVSIPTKDLPDMEKEKHHWVPEEAYSLAHDVRDQTSGEITPKLMNKLLISLNKIWRLREKQVEQRIKNKYQNEIDKLKREKLMKGQYDSVQAKQSLARTRTQLKKAEEKLREYANKLTKIKGAPAGMNVIDEALMIVASVQEEKRELVEENESLKNRFQEIEELRRNSDYEKTKFMEGASWMATKAIREKEKHDERNQELFKEFDMRIVGCENDPSIAIRTMKWIKEALEVSNMELEEILGSLFDSAQYNMEEAMRRVQKVFSDFEPNILSLSQDTTPIMKSSPAKSD